MAFYPLEELKKGKYEFVFTLMLNESDYKKVINDVRTSPDKLDIIKGFLGKAKGEIPSFCFEIIYDMEEYKDEVLILLKNKNIFDLLINSVNKISNILSKTSWGKEFVISNLDVIIQKEELLLAVLNYNFYKFEDNQDIIKKLSLHPNLHIRFEFMYYLVTNYPDKVSLIYDDITKYLTSYTQKENEPFSSLELMHINDITKLANLIYKSLDKDVWYKIKEHILNNYKSNSLAYFLLVGSENCEERLIDFKADSDRLFETSCDYKLTIYEKYSEFISEQLISDFEKYLNYFNFYDARLKTIIYHNLWEELTTYVDKYLSLSKNDRYGYLGGGTTSSCYQIGDYVFKLINRKWSYEEVICPRLYLILKNLEEHYIRDEKGYVLAGIEVQKYLDRGIAGVKNRDIRNFKKELNNLGYYVKDRLVGGKFGDNCMLLDSYKDADCDDPESLPETFKKKPLVLVDHDLVYRVGQKDIKCRLSSEYLN